MTANAFIEDKQRSKEVGMNEHLSKPLDEKTLLDMIGNICRREEISADVEITDQQKIFKG